MCDTEEDEEVVLDADGRISGVGGRLDCSSRAFEFQSQLLADGALDRIRQDCVAGACRRWDHSKRSAAARSSRACFDGVVGLEMWCSSRPRLPALGSGDRSVLCAD